MKAFLITFKPATENPARGWPLEELQKLVQQNQNGEKPTEEWRFKNLKDVSVGDRTFLILQGKRGPAVIGYGEIAGKPRHTPEGWYAPVRFESIVDPTVEVLANREDLLSIEDGQRFWRIQSSGVLLPESVGSDLETLAVGNSPKPSNKGLGPNPDWTRDERILALDLYLQHRRAPPAKDSPAIRDLVKTIKRLGERLNPVANSSATFRNQNSVYMKLMNFRSFDPLYTSQGKTGLVRSAEEDKEVWEEFANDPSRCHQVAKAIVLSLDDQYSASTWLGQGIEDYIQEATEGRLLTRIHIARERNRHLVESKRKQVMNKYGKLTCEACGFDFLTHYGERGKGFIECHHTKPVATLAEGQKTHVDDLALVCANCHRIIHRRRPWLSIPELKDLLQSK